MKVFLLLLLAISAIAQDTAAPTVKAPEKLSDVDLADYLKAVEAIDNSAEARIKSVYDQAQEAKDALLGSFKDRMKQIMSDKKARDAEKAMELQLIKQQLIDEYKAETDKIFMTAVGAVEKYKEAYEAARDAEKKNVQDKIDSFKKAVNETMEMKKQQFQTAVDDVNNYLKQVDGLYQKHKADTQAQLDARRSALKEKLAGLFGDLKTRSDALKADKERIKTEITDYLKKSGQLKVDGGEAVGEVIKEIMTEALEQKLESQLNTEMKDAVKQEVLDRLTHPKAAPLIIDGAAPIAPAVKATLLDTLTGASAWETVAWVLLGLCILLSVALIAMIVYQVSQRNKYNRIDGVDSANRAHVDERAPIYPGNTAAPLSYTQEKGVSSSAPPGPSGSSPSASPFAPTATAADSLPPAGETQQF